MRPLHPASLATACLLAACASDSAPTWAGTTETLPGGGTLVRNPAAGLWTPEAAWTLEPELRIGRVEGEGPDLFARISALSVDGAGRIWVIEGQSREVRVFDAGGAHVRTFGRQGEGPGEFQQPGGIVFDPEGMPWIPDAGNRRYMRFDTTGTPLESRPFDTRALRFLFTGTMTADGQLYDVDMRPPAGGGPSVSPLFAAAGLGGGREYVRPVLRVDGGPVSADTIPIPALEDPPQPYTSGNMFLGVPFAPAVHWVLDPRGWQWFGASDAYRIVRRSFAGDTSLIVERAYEPVPVTSEDIDEWLAGTGPQRIQERGGSIDRSRIPSTKPVFDDLLVDDAGYLWVRMGSAAAGTTFDVFDPDGRYLGALRTPDELARIPRPVIRGDLLYGVAQGEYDEPHVVRYRIAGR